MTAGREGRIAVTMPQLGETVAEGTVLRWLKQVGDEVADQEPLLEISTDKVDAEVPSPAGGVLAEIVVGEDETVDVGTVLAHLVPGAGSTGPRPEAAAAPPAAPPAEERSSSPPTNERSSPTPMAAAPVAAPVSRRSGPRHRHSPRVRRLAHDGGVDPASVTGTGPGGRVTPDDVTSAIRAASVHPVAEAGPPADVGPGRSYRTIVAEVDVPSAQWIDAGPGGAAASFVVAVAAALRGRPELLRGASDGAVDLAVSWSTGEGTSSRLLAHADDLNMGAVGERLRASGPAGIEPSQAGFGVSFLQDGGVVLEVEAPAPGQVGSLSFGAPTARVVVLDADGAPAIAIRLRSHVAVSYDPTAVGRDSALGFLREVTRRAAAHA